MRGTRTLSLLALVGTLVACGRWNYDPVAEAEVDPDAWLDPTWSRRRLLQLDNRGQNSELRNFPILVALDEGRIDFARTTAGGSDLRFVDTASGLVLPHEIELWQPESGARSIVWVRVPLVLAGSNESAIWMYYGNPAATDVQDASTLWQEFEAVWHLGDTSDSSASGINGTSLGATATPGIIAGAHQFDGVDDRITLGDNTNVLRNATSATLSAFINPNSFPSEEPHIVGIGVGANSPSVSSRAALAVAPDNTLSVLARADDDEIYSDLNTSGVVEIGIWSQVVAVIDYEAATLDAYVDGTLVGRGTADNFTRTSTSDTPARSSTIGSEEDETEDFFDGAIDEVRVTTSLRSPDWIRAQYQTLRDMGFVSYGPEEALGAP